MPSTSGLTQLALALLQQQQQQQQTCFPAGQCHRLYKLPNSEHRLMTDKMTGITTTTIITSASARQKPAIWSNAQIDQTCLTMGQT